MFGFGCLEYIDGIFLLYYLKERLYLHSSQPMPSLSPSKLCGSGPIILKFLEEMSPQSNKGGGGSILISGNDGVKEKIAQRQPLKSFKGKYFLWNMMFPTIAVSGRLSSCSNVRLKVKCF